MGEITIDEIDRTITILKMRALDQAKQLTDTKDREFAQQLRPAHMNLIQHIYRMVRIRDGLIIEEPEGMVH